jgi:hypothetical protein
VKWVLTQVTSDFRYGDRVYHKWRHESGVYHGPDESGDDRTVWVEFVSSGEIRASKDLLILLYHPTEEERKPVPYQVTVNAAELFTGVTGLGASSRRNPTEVTITRPTQLEAVADAVVVLLSTVPRDSITDVLAAVRDAGLSLFVLDSPKQTAALEELYGVIARDNQPKENPSDDGRG